MELNQALKIVLELAEQNMLVDNEMPDEMKQQMGAVENVRLHLQELESPSPIQVVLMADNALIHEAISNVPVQLVVIDESIESAEDGKVRLFPSMGDDEYYVDQPEVTCDPARVATLVAEATA